MSWFGDCFGFRKRSRVSISDTRFWSGLKGWVDGRLLWLAAYLGRKTLYWNRGSKVIALAVFCLVFGSACLYLLMRALGWLS